MENSSKWSYADWQGLVHHGKEQETYAVDLQTL